MHKQIIRIPSNQDNIILRSIITLSIIIFPIIAIIWYQKFGTFGLFICFAVALGSFWLLFIINEKKKSYTIVENMGISIFLKDGGKINLSWDQIIEIGFQAILKIDPIFPSSSYGSIYLAITTGSTSQIINHQYDKQYMFIPKDLNEYMGEKKADININCTFMKDPDVLILMEIIIKNKKEVKKYKPLIKTQNQKKYDEIFKENFNLT